MHVRPVFVGNTAKNCVRTVHLDKIVARNAFAKMEPTAVRKRVNAFVRPAGRVIDAIGHATTVFMAKIVHRDASVSTMRRAIR